MRSSSIYSEEFEVKVCVNQEFVLSLLLFAIVVNVITENVRKGVVNELLYVDNPVFISKTTEGLKKNFGIRRMRWKEGFKSEHQKNKSDGTRVGRTIQKQDRSM